MVREASAPVPEIVGIPMWCIAGFLIKSQPWYIAEPPGLVSISEIALARSKEAPPPIPTTETGFLPAWCACTWRVSSST